MSLSVTARLVAASFTACNDGYNSASLADMRDAARLSLEDFDAGMRELRVAGILTLSSADRYLSDRDRAAGIRENGEVLTHCHKR